MGLFGKKPVDKKIDEMSASELKRARGIIDRRLEELKEAKSGSSYGDPLVEID